MKRVPRTLVFAAAFVSLLSGTARAQLRPPVATLTPLVERDSVAAGSSTRVALQITLPDGFHIQSNKPRDPSLIATVLTIDAPAGVTTTEVVFPTPVDLKQAGSDDPLAVFEHDVAVGVTFAVASSAPSGELVIPVHLRYQACNDTACFAPKTAEAEWKIRIGAAGAVQHADVFDKIAFGHGEALMVPKLPAVRMTTTPRTP